MSLPGIALTSMSVQRLELVDPEAARFWRSSRRTTVAGVQYTLAYELDVLRDQGRWEISAVQMDPDA